MPNDQVYPITDIFVHDDKGIFQDDSVDIHSTQIVKRWLGEHETSFLYVATLWHSVTLFFWQGSVWLKVASLGWWCNSWVSKDTNHPLRCIIIIFISLLNLVYILCWSINYFWTIILHFLLQNSNLTATIITDVKYNKLYCILNY